MVNDIPYARPSQRLSLLRVGYVSSAASSGTSTFPLYTYTIADTSAIYQPTPQGYQIANPSLPFCTILIRIKLNHAIFAVAPKSSSDSNAALQAQLLRTYFLDRCLPRDFSSTIVYFNSQSDLEDYVTNSNYDDTGYGNGKVAFGVVIYSVDIATNYWEYAIRANYTSVFDSNDPTVACLYDGCEFTYSVPSTKYYTQDLFKPQSANYLYGYSYSGFSTIQLTVDEFIFAVTTNTSISSHKFIHTPLKVMASVSMMPTESFKTDDFQFVISSTLGIFYMLSFLYPVSRIIRSLVLDKETRVREGGGMPCFFFLFFSNSHHIAIPSMLFNQAILLLNLNDRNENDGTLRHYLQLVLVDHDVCANDFRLAPNHAGHGLVCVRVLQQALCLHLLRGLQSSGHQHVFPAQFALFQVKVGIVAGSNDIFRVFFPLLRGK
jgi:hypothetical protein